MRCRNCGCESEGNFCSNCGMPLNEENYETPENLKSGDNWTSVCPVCKIGSLQDEVKKGLFGLTSKNLLICQNCNSQFEEIGGKYKLSSVPDQSNQIWKDYGKQLLTSIEWQRISRGGLSDEKQREADLLEYYSQLRSGEMPINGDPNCPIILKKDEEHVISLPNINLNEPRSVRRTSGGYGGPRIRIAKGVTIGVGSFGASSESHEEIRNIDTGTLTVTTKRVVFKGSKKNLNIDLLKIISIDPYSDGIGVNRENKEKTEYFLNLPRVNLDIGSEERKYSEPFSGLMLMYMIEGLINRRNNHQLSQKSSQNNFSNDTDSKKAHSHENRKYDIWVERNLKGKDLEKEGDVEGAIKLYEENIAEGFDGNHPYDRLAIIYRKRKQYSDEIRVLDRAIFVFENYASPERGDVTPKLEKFRERLEKAKSLEEKNRG